MTVETIKESFEKEIQRYKEEIAIEKNILSKLDPIETNDDIYYELTIQLIAIERVYNKIFKTNGCTCKRGSIHSINRICQRCKGIVPIKF